MIKGIILSVVASLLFGVMYYYTSMLTPLDGEEIYGWRTLLTLPFLTLFMLFSGDWARVKEMLHWLRQRPQRVLLLLLTTSILGVQLWLFLWAPLHGMALDVSLGYFAAADHGVGRASVFPRSPVCAAKAGGPMCLGWRG